MPRHKAGTLVWVRDRALSDNASGGTTNQEYVQNGESRMWVVREWTTVDRKPGNSPAYECTSIVNGAVSYWFPKEIIAAKRVKTDDT